MNKWRQKEEEEGGILLWKRRGGGRQACLGCSPGMREQAQKKSRKCI